MKYFGRRCRESEHLNCIHLAVGGVEGLTSQTQAAPAHVYSSLEDAELALSAAIDPHVQALWQVQLLGTYFWSSFSNIS